MVDLVGDVLRCDAERARRMSLINILFRQSEIAQFEIAIVEEEEILGLQIAVDLNERSVSDAARARRVWTYDSFGMQEEEGAGYFACEENDLLVSKGFGRLMFEKVEERARVGHFQQEEQSLGVLKGEEQLHVAEILSFEDEILAQRLHRIERLGAFDQADLRGKWGRRALTDSVMPRPSGRSG